MGLPGFDVVFGSAARPKQSSSRQNTPMRTLYLLQPLIPPYRLKVFEALSAVADPEVTVFAGDASTDLVRHLEPGKMGTIRHRFAKTYLLGLRRRRAIFWQPAAWLAISRDRPDAVVVHGNIYDLTSWLVLLWGRFVGRPVLIWTIGLQRQESGLKAWLRRHFYSLARGLLLYGDYPKRLLVESGYNPDRLHVIYNSLDTAAQRAAEARVSEVDVVAVRERLGMGADARALIFIGRIVPRKRLSILIKMAARLIREGRDLHVVLIGEGDDMDRLEALAREENCVDRLHFTGAIYDEVKIACYMLACHAAVVPEAGLPIIHPMSYGLPLIISDNIAQHGTEWEAVEEGKTGFFYRDGDVDALASAIRRCLDDDAARARMGTNCRARVEAYYTADGHATRFMAGVARFSDLKVVEGPAKGAVRRPTRLTP